jgi:hypothetical protein
VDLYVKGHKPITAFARIAEPEIQTKDFQNAYTNEMALAYLSFKLQAIVGSYLNICSRD